MLAASNVVFTVFSTFVLGCICILVGLSHFYRGRTDKGHTRRRALMARSVPWVLMGFIFFLVTFIDYPGIFQRALLRSSFGVVVITEAGYYFPVLCDMILGLRKRIFNADGNNNSDSSCSR
jgi:hypothetical protein